MPFLMELVEPDRWFGNFSLYRIYGFNLVLRTGRTVAAPAGAALCI